MRNQHRPCGQLLLATLLATAATFPACLTLAQPQPVTNSYHGQLVVDEYQWLESATNQRTRQWVTDQNNRARTHLDRTDARPRVEAQLRELFARTSANYSGLAWNGGRFFYLQFKPPAQQAVLMTVSALDDISGARLVFDPNLLDAAGGTSIDWFVPSPDGSIVAVSLSEHGSEKGTLHFFATASGRQLVDKLPRVNGPTAGGSAAWSADGKGVFYTRYPKPGERPGTDLDFYQQIYFHQLGTAVESDRFEVGREFPRIAEIDLTASQDNRWLLATVSNGDGGEHAHWLRSPAGSWRQITRFEDGIQTARFGRDPVFIEYGRDEALYMLSHKEASKGNILRLPLATPELGRSTIAVAETANAIADFAPSAGGIYVTYLKGGPMELNFYDALIGTNRLIAPRRGGTNAADTGPITVSPLLVTRGDEVVFRTVSFIEPFKWQRYDPNKDATRADVTELKGESPADFGDIEVVRSTAVSKDGTKVPLTILRRKGTRLNGTNPTLLTGYGGFGISTVPRFDFTRRLWLDQGGIIAIANLRGGGEFGEEWHRSGNLVHKQNVFDDFAACAQFLIRTNYTRPSLLAIEGGSNGGLLMGAMLTQHPELFQAVVAHVGIYDMLRLELDPNGAFNTTEFGSVRDLAQFTALHAYSPYHQVKEGQLYPATLLLTGEHDGRANPAHSRKMTARLQAANRSQNPILLRTSAGTGHGRGTPLDARIAELADVYAFLLERLGLFYSDVERGPWAGAMTSQEATIKAKLPRAGMKAKLVVSVDAAFANPFSPGPATSETNHGRVVTFELKNLKPATRYYYALEIDGRLHRNKAGQFQTFPEGPASFTMAFASCAKTGSTSDVFDRIREHRPLFYMNVGDFHYLNIATNDSNRFRAAYDAVLASPQQAQLYRDVPFVYVWDDHDFGGNSSGRRSLSHEAARLTYQEYVPHYPLGAGSGDVPIYQSFSVGRVKFILTDLRSERDSVSMTDNETKTMMGQKQKEWFKQELMTANGKFPLICWVSSVPWLGERGTNYYRGLRTNYYGFVHHTNLVAPPVDTSRRRSNTRSDQDHWSMFATERREIADFIKSNNIRGVCILHGDSHMLAADDGSNSDFATGGGVKIPVMCAAPLDQDSSIKGGPYSQGVYRTRRNEGAFGLFSVTDKGDHLDVAYSGRNLRDEEKISLRFSVPATPVGSVTH